MKLALAISTAALLAASPVVAQDRTWTGPYIGAHVGGAWGNASTTDDAKDWGNDKKFIGPFDYNPSGALGGATAGYNLQIDRVVVGIEGDLGYLGLSESMDTPSSQSGNHQTLNVDGGLYGVAAARAGILVTPATLVYGKGGFAFFDGEATQTTTAKGYETHGTSTFTGWAAGGGIEHRLTDNLSIRVEYLHMDFGSEDGDQTSISDAPIGHVYGNHTSLDADTVKLGIAYKF
jgi:outer membrane immunogenic protein